MSTSPPPAFLARQALARGDHASALAWLDRAGPGADPEAGLLRAQALAGLGRLNEAMVDAQAFLKGHVGHSQALGLVSWLDRAGAVAPREGGHTVVRWQPGHVIDGRWEVRGNAAGGMGLVDFVYDRQWETELAVKTFRPHGRPESVERLRQLFQREARQWLDLGAHPNVVTAHYVLEVDGALRLFMEYVPGHDLARTRRGPAPLLEVLDLGIQIASGIQHAHNKGLVHRDLKPQNCLIAEDGLRVTDFGLAGPLAQVKDAILGDASCVGTPLYMAPEQWQSLAWAAAPADVYALGLILFELAAGEHPFDLAPACRRRYLGRVGGVLTGLMAAESLRDDVAIHALQMLHAHVVPIDVREVAASAPAPLAGLIAHCLQKDPAARPAIGDVRSALLAIHRGASGGRPPRTAASALPDIEAAESNRACSYLVMGDVAAATGILDKLLLQPDALLAWLNRSVITINTQQPCQAACDVALATRLETLPHQATRGPAVEAFGREVGRWVIPHGADVAAFSPDRRSLCGAGAGDSSSVCWLHDLASGAVSTWGEVEGEVVWLGFDEGGRPLAVVIADEEKAAVLRPGSGGTLDRRELGRFRGVGPRGHCLIEDAPGEIRSVSARDGRAVAGWRISPTHQHRRHLTVDAEGTRLLWVSEEEGRPRLCLMDGRSQVLASPSMRCWPVRLVMPSVHRLAVQYADGLVRIVDLPNRRVIGQHPADPCTMICDPDLGKIALSRGKGTRISEEGSQDRERIRCHDAFRALCPIPLTSPKGVGWLTLIDLGSGRQLFEVPTGDDSAPRALSRDGAWIAAASASARKTRLWPDLTTRAAAPIPPLRTHFSPSLSARHRTEQRKLHARLLDELEQTPGPNAWRALVDLREAAPDLQPDLNAVVRSARACSPWAASRGVRRFFRTWSRATPEVTALAIAAGGEWVASAHADSSLRIWSQAGDLVTTTTLPAVAGALFVSPDGKSLFAAAGDHGGSNCPVIAIDVSTWALRWSHPVAARTLAISKNGKRVAAVVRFASVLLLLDEQGQAQPLEAASAVAWRPAGDSSGAPEEMSVAHGVAVSHEGRSLGSAGVDVTRMVWSPAGRWLAAGDTLWTFANWRPEKSSSPPPRVELDEFWPPGRAGVLSGFQFTAGGRVLVATRTSQDSSSGVAWIDVRAGEVRALIPVRCTPRPALSSDGTLMAAASEGCVDLWGIEHEWAFAEDMAREHEPLPETDEEGNRRPVPPQASRLGAPETPGARVGRLWSKNTPPMDILDDLMRAQKRPGVDPAVADILADQFTYQFGRHMNLTFALSNERSSPGLHVKVGRNKR